MSPPARTRSPERRPPIDPRMRSRRIAVIRDQGRRRRRVLLGLLGAAALAGSVAAFLYDGPLRADHVTVLGALHTPVAEIVAAGDLTGRPPLVDVQPGRSAARIEALPWVATARVERRWPDGVAVRVSERTPALAQALPGGSWAVIDATGRVLTVGARPAGLVVLSGPAVPGAPGSTLAPVMRPAVHVVGALPKAFAGQVTGVAVDPARDVTLTLDSGLTVLLGTDVDLQLKYEDVAAMLASGNLTSARAIDVIVPQSPLVSPRPLQADGTPVAGG